MKKILSIMLAAVMAVSALVVSALPVMAEDVLSPTASTAVDKKPTLQVNGVTTTTDVTYAADPEDSNVITFTYIGDGDITGWETNLAELGFVEGEDYLITENEDGTLTITLISDEAIAAWKNGDFVINTLVDFGEEEEATAPSSSPATTKPNTSAKSPSTGASTAVIAGTVAAAGAGIAVLAALKKRDAE